MNIVTRVVQARRVSASMHLHAQCNCKSSMQLVPPPVHTYTHAQIELKPYVLDGQMCDECQWCAMQWETCTLLL